MCVAESLSTLKFANRAKNIRNAARVNEDVDQRTLLRKYERELRRLRAELQQRQRELVDKRHLLEVCPHAPFTATKQMTVNVLLKETHSKKEACPRIEDKHQSASKRKSRGVEGSGGGGLLGGVLLAASMAARHKSDLKDTSQTSRRHCLLTISL